MPDSTPNLLVPYPVPDDPLVDYPALGLELAERIEALLTDDASGAMVYRTGNMGLAGGGGNTVLWWQAVEYDTDGYFAASPNPSRLTVPAAGLYLVTVELDIQTAGAAALDTLHIYRSGNDRWTTRRHPEAAAFGWHWSLPIFLGAGEFVEIAYTNGQAGAHTLTGGRYITLLSIARLGLGALPAMSRPAPEGPEASPR